MTIARVMIVFTIASSLFCMALAKSGKATFYTDYTRNFLSFNLLTTYIINSNLAYF